MSRRQFLGMSVALAARCRAQQSFDGLRASIQDRIRQSRVPSVAVAVARNGTILWEEGFGWADIEKKIPATADTIYSVASLTKPFTATALMTLVEAGKVDLDAPINNYLGRGVKAMVGDARDATVRRVANHTSGLPLHVHFFYRNEPGNPPPTDETIRRYGLLVTEPGTNWEYSNLGFGILGRVIERVSKRNYGEVMESAVLRPLSLRNTSVGEHRVPGATYAVRYDSAGKPVAGFVTDHAGASDLWASVHDLITFGMFHAKERQRGQAAILTDETIDAMHTPGTGAAAHYGIGWNIGLAKGYKVVAHGGDMEGVTSLLLMLPSEQLVVAAVCNRRGNIPGPIIDDIIEDLLPGWKGRPPDSPPSPTPAPPKGMRGEWTGQLASYSRKQKFSLKIGEGKSASAALDNQKEVMVRNPAFDGVSLTGLFDGFIDTLDARIHPHEIGFALRLRGGLLTGPTTAFTRPPSGWMGNALTSWVELKKRS